MYLKTVSVGWYQFMKRSTRSMLIAVIIIIALVTVCVAAVIYNANAPLATRQDKTVYTPQGNVKIQAVTFNGNIEVHPSTSNQIEVIYDIKASNGYLNDIKTTSNETKTENLTTIITKATLQVNQASQYEASLVINVPASGNYNLTLTTSNGDVNVQVGNCAEIVAMTYNGDVNVGLPQGTLFTVAASVGNGNITHQGIALDTSNETATRLKGVTTGGEGSLELALNSGNGNIAIQYFTP